MHAFRGYCIQFGRGNRFDFRDDDNRLDFGEQGVQLLRIGHIEDTVFVGDLLCRGAFVAVGGAHPRAQAHEFDGDFAAKLTGAEQQNLGARGVVGSVERGAEPRIGWCRDGG